MADIDRPDSTDLPASDRIEITRTEIEQTRGDMAETLNAIKDKLDPKALMDEAKDRVGEVTTDLAEKAKSTVHTIVEDVSGHAKEAAHNAVSGAVDEAKEVVGNVVHSAQHTVGGVMDTARGAGSSVVDIIKGNPIPSALVALGAAWLYMKKRDEDRGPRSSGAYQYRDEFDYDSRSDRGTGSGRSFVDQGKDRVGQAVDAVGDAAHAARDKAGDVIDSAKDAVGGAMGSAKHAGMSIIDTVERNPIPAVVAALGIGWLYLKNQDDNKGLRYDRDNFGYAERYPGGYSERDFSGDSGSGVKGTVGNAVDSVKEKAGQVGEAVGSAVDTAREKVGQVTSQARDRAGEIRSRAMEQTRQTGGTLMRTLQENPIPVGMVALGLGAAVGLMVPATDQENQWMGEARDRFVEKAQDTAKDVTSKVRNVADEALGAARETAEHVARDQGLTPDNRSNGIESPGAVTPAWTQP